MDAREELPRVDADFAERGALGPETTGLRDLHALWRPVPGSGQEGCQNSLAKFLNHFPKLVKELR